jgi:hypothetical protein
MFLKKEGSLQTKQLLCYYLRVFVHTCLQGMDNGKMAIVGTDQRNSAQHGGCQAGPVPFCLDFQQMIFGKWENWPSWKDGGGTCQRPPEEEWQESWFEHFMEGCLQHGKDLEGKKLTDEYHSEQGKIKLCYWLKGKREERKRKRAADTAKNTGEQKPNSQNEGCYRRCRLRNIITDLC